MRRRSGERGSATRGINPGAGGLQLRSHPARVDGGEGQTVTIILHNRGAAPHNLTVPDLALRSDDVPPGMSASLTFTSPRDGTFRMLCSVAGHEQAGMAGYLTID